jgi:hypothetical protein
MTQAQLAQQNDVEDASKDAEADAKMRRASFMATYASIVRWRPKSMNGVH